MKYKTNFQGVHGEWELINRDSGKKASDGSIIAEYKCKKCKTTRYVTPGDMKRKKYICKGCTENYHKYNFIGKTYGKLTVVSYAYKKNKRYYYYCSCSCNNKIRNNPVEINSLRSGNTRSCGCITGELKTKHGMVGTRIYNIYDGMKQRCYNSNNRIYNRYGGRGIYVADEWLDKDRGFMNFYNWSMSNNYSDDLTIDRIDNDGPYAPWNCRWATYREQANNTSRNHYVNISGVNYNISEVSRKYNINRNTLTYHLNNNKSMEQILYEYYGLRSVIRFVQPDTPLRSPIRFI